MKSRRAALTTALSLAVLLPFLFVPPATATTTAAGSGSTGAAAPAGPAPDLTKLCARLQRTPAKVPLCTHGADSVAALDETGQPPPAAPAATAALCDAGGVTGKRVEILYGVPQDKPNRYGNMLTTMRNVLAQVDDNLDSSDGATTQHYRFLCENGTDVTIRNVTLLPVGTDNAFTWEDYLASVQNQVERGLGPKNFVDDDRVYMTFVDRITSHYPYGGQGSLFEDDRPDPSLNANNSQRPKYSMTAYFDAGVVGHEIAHNIGAVQLSSPHSSGGHHCYDGNDLMCYSDGGSYFQAGGQMTSTCAPAAADLMDCGKDDYYDPGTPPASSYLAAHWNTANSGFLSASVRDSTPPTLKGRTPAPGAAEVAATATVTATFSEPVQGVSSSSFSLTAGTASVASTVTYDPTTRTATLTPASPLASNTVYTAALRGGATEIRDAAGNALETTSWSFTTSSATPPVIAETFASSAASFTKVAGGTWGVVSGRYVLTAPASTTAPNANLAVHNAALTGDFTLTAAGSTTATTSAWNDFSVVFGYQDTANYYFASFSESNGDSVSGIFEVAGGVRTQLADITSLITAGTMYPVRIERQGSAIRVYRSGLLVASATDGTFTGGKVGFGSKNDGGSFDDLAVTGTLAPLTAPGSPSGVTATAGEASATVSWTAPASDGGAPISSYVATASPGGATTAVAGPARSATVTGLTNGTAYTLTVTAMNSIGTGPASAPSTAVTPTSSATPPVIAETFASSAASFTKVAGGTWGVVSGRYVLTAPASTTAPNANLAVHNAALTGDFTLTAAGSTTATTSAWNDFSVVFGYQDTANYYFASFSESNGDSVSGIFEVAGGVRTQLADITSLITAGTMYPVRIERQGSAIRVYRSGLLVASATDGTFTGGKVGFGSKNDGGSFDDLAVTGTL